MPYRRLPNTDEARIRALKQATENEQSRSMDELIISLKTCEEARNFLLTFERVQHDYKNALQEQVNSNRVYQKLVKQAKLYISHFIQVLNLSVIRNEIKTEYKSFYGLEPHSFQVPDILSDTAVLEWGDKIIKGELERMSRGGAPIYNPTIAKVRVHYDVFRDAYYRQKILQQNTTRALEALSDLREKADRIILDVWNQVEAKFNNFEMEARLEKCRQYGIVYYYRRGEKVKLNAAG